MRIAVTSDLHLEFDAHLRHRVKGRGFYDDPPQPDADFLVLAGDIHEGPLVFEWARRHFRLPTILIGGNHEPFGRELFRSIAFNRQASETTTGLIVFLERATWEGASERGERVRFIGTTLWTDFSLYGTPERSMAAALAELADFKEIKIERGYRLRTLRPSDTRRVHRQSVEFIQSELARPFPGITVVVTHHAPSPRSISATFARHRLNPAFASDLEALIRHYSPDLWIHGHMHESFDYRIGETRIVCNPRGYMPDQLNPAFDPRFTVDVSARSSRRSVS